MDKFEASLLRCSCCVENNFINTSKNSEKLIDRNSWKIDKSVITFKSVKVEKTFCPDTEKSFISLA
jgi:hypothetical protein